MWWAGHLHLLPSFEILIQETWAELSKSFFTPNTQLRTTILEMFFEGPSTNVFK